MTHLIFVIRCEIWVKVKDLFFLPVDVQLLPHYLQYIIMLGIGNFNLLFAGKETEAVKCELLAHGHTATE